jgi:uncharacterized metal-binding protein YceD (DUF177 family)
MGIAQKYSIAYHAMTKGHHSLDVAVDGELFREMESTEVKDAACDVHIEVERMDSGLNLQVAITGKAVVECDRCLEDCDIPIDFNGELAVRFSDTVSDYDGEQMWIAQGEELSLAQYIYESIIISLPYRRVHADGECNPDMLARFTPANNE